jgi:hypothetical protein
MPGKATGLFPGRGQPFLGWGKSKKVHGLLESSGFLGLAWRGMRGDFYFSFLFPHFKGGVYSMLCAIGFEMVDNNMKK